MLQERISEVHSSQEDHLALTKDKVTENEALNDEMHSRDLELRPRQLSPPKQHRPPLPFSPPELLLKEFLHEVYYCWVCKDVKTAGVYCCSCIQDLHSHIKVDYYDTPPSIRRALNLPRPQDTHGRISGIFGPSRLLL